jgi:hypothetical protein
MWVPGPRSMLLFGAASVVALVVSSCGSTASTSGFDTGGSGSASSSGTGSGSGFASGTGSHGGAGNGSGSSSGTGSSGGSGSGGASGVGTGSSSGSGSSGSSGGSGSSAGTASGSGSGSTSGSGTGADAGPACTATVSSGAIALTSNYLPASVIANGGYAYAYNDMKGSTACLDSTALCGTGTTAVADAAGTIWGAGIGINLNQAQWTAANPTPAVNNYAATGTGITYALSNLPPQGARIIIDNGGANYCAPVAAASGTVNWASFNTKCWDNSGTFLTAAPATATHIQFQVTADAATTAFSLCVTQVAFATTMAPPPDAGTGDGGTSAGGCAWTGGPSTGSGELTCYYFGQGTATGSGCPSYKTYCGYCGTETGSNTGGTCASGITDTVANTSTAYFAAFPIGTFGQGKYCGMCVDVSYAGKTITATIVDECATCTNSAGHIDLSLSAAAALGVGQGSATGDPKNGVTWNAVACSVSGNIVAVFNSGSSGQIYFQNVAFPVASATAGGATGNQQNGYWNFGGLVAGKSVTLTDTLGHTVTGTIPTSSGGSIGVQFPTTCN